MEYGGNEFTITFYFIDAANSDKTMIRALSEEVFVLLVCWVFREEMKCKMQVERWDMPMQGHSVCNSITCTPSAIAT